MTGSEPNKLVMLGLLLLGAGVAAMFTARRWRAASVEE
jgi:LPXTG-motif cell wall-anchored protein